jgi:hypothetical protein
MVLFDGNSGIIFIFAFPEIFSYLLSPFGALKMINLNLKK